MGCWNTTCALTNLSIMSGEPVVVLFLEEQWKGSYCYANHFFFPWPFMWTGTYDDYGNLEDPQCEYEDMFYRAVANCIVESHDKERVTPDEVNIKNLFKWQHRGCLFLKARSFTGQVEQREFTPIFFKRSVWDAAMKMTLGDWEPYTKEGLHAEDDLLASDDMSSIALMKRELWVYNNAACRMFTGMASSGGQVQCNLHDLFNEVTDPTERQKLADHISQVAWMAHVFEDLRKMWIRPSGDGSQNDNSEAHRQLAEITLANLIQPEED